MIIIVIYKQVALQLPPGYISSHHIQTLSLLSKKGHSYIYIAHKLMILCRYSREEYKARLYKEGEGEYRTAYMLHITAVRMVHDLCNLGQALNTRETGNGVYILFVHDLA